MDLSNDFPDRASLEKLVERARAERSLHLRTLLAAVFAGARKAMKSFLDREPLRDSRIPWGPRPCSGTGAPD